MPSQISAAPPPSRKYSRPPIPTQFVVQLKNENVDVKEVNEVKETKEKREVKEIVVQPEEKRERAKSRGREDSRDKVREYLFIRLIFDLCPGSSPLSSSFCQRR